MPDSILSRFMRGMFSTGFARLINMGLGLLSLTIVVRHIAPEGYGAYILLRVICTFLAEVSSLGLTLVIPKYVASAGNIGDKFRLINTVIYFRIVTVVLLSCLIIAARPELVILFSSSPQLVNLFLYVPVLFGLGSLSRTLDSVLQGLFRFRVIGIVVSISSIANFILTMLFVFPLNLDAMGLIFADVISTALSVSMAYLAIHIRDKREINCAILKEMLLFGLPLQIQYMLDFVYSRIDTLVIGSFLGTTGIAFYEIARKLPDSLMFLYDAFRSVYYPFIAKFYADGEPEKATRTLNNSTRVLSFLTSFAALMAVLFGKEIITTLFSESYLPSYYAFVILMFGLNLSVLDNTLGYSLVAIGDPGKPLIVNIVRTSISLLLNVVVTPIYSFVGAALVSGVSNLIAAPLNVHFLWRRKVAVEIASFLKPIVISFGYGLLFLLLGSSLLPLKILCVFLFILTCLVGSVINVGDCNVVWTEIVGVVYRLRQKEVAGSTEGIK